MEMYADGKGYRRVDEAMCLGFYKSISHIMVSIMAPSTKIDCKVFYTEDICVCGAIFSMRSVVGIGHIFSPLCLLSQVQPATSYSFFVSSSFIFCNHE